MKWKQYKLNIIKNGLIINIVCLLSFWGLFPKKMMIELSKILEIQAKIDRKPNLQLQTIYKLIRDKNQAS